jgi:membrane-associated protein
VSGTDVLSATWWLATLGTGGVFLVLFVETGLLVGFFLPGDSLLFTAGLLTATGAGSLHLSLPWVLVAAVAGAVLGAQTGFVVGRRAGPPLLERSRSRRLRAGAERAGEYLERYGHRKAIVLARFVPIVRTVLNPLAGAVGVPARVFLVWQTLGGAVWAIGLTLAGHVLGTLRSRGRPVPAAGGGRRGGRLLAAFRDRTDPGASPTTRRAISAVRRARDRRVR